MASVINVSVKNLRKIGYNSALEWMKGENNTYIGRACHYVGISANSMWHNPYSVKKHGREEALRLYEIYARDILYNRLDELEGKTLGCWCHPQACHGDVLVRLLAEKRSK
jgi:hypothetical protein